MGSRIGGSDGTGTFVSNFLTQNGTSSFTADPDGFGQVAQEISGDVVKNYTYRADGKTSGFQSGNLQATYYYDGLDRLIAVALNDNGNSYTQSATYLADESVALLGKSGDGSVTTYISGHGENEPLGEVKGGIGKGYITDHLGSVLNAAPAGSSKLYGIFGEVSGRPSISPSSPAVEYAYAGYGYRRETGHYLTLNRQYQPTTGNWTTQDPLGFDSGDGANYYSYVLHNPLIYTDPSGLNRAESPVIGGGGFPFIVGAPLFCPLPGDNMALSKKNDDDGGHTKNKRPSSREKHEKGDRRRGQDNKGEGKDRSGRMPYRDGGKTRR